MSDSLNIFSLTHSFCLFQGVQERANLTSPLLSKEDPIFGSLSHKLGRSVDEVGHRIHQGLQRVRSACTSLHHKLFKYSVPPFPSLQISELSFECNKKERFYSAFCAEMGNTYLFRLSLCGFYGCVIIWLPFCLHHKMIFVVWWVVFLVSAQ